MNTLHTVLLAVALSTLAHDAMGIINGRKAEKNSLQYMVSVQGKGTHMCGGFLIRGGYVLTAAHCDKEQSQPLSVVLGTHNLKLKHESYPVVRKIKHPLYNNPQLGNDIMLLKLSGKNVMRCTGVKPISIPKTDVTYNQGTNCMVAGWGRTDRKDKRKDKVMDLMVTNVTTFTFQQCQREWNYVNIKLPKNVLCAGGSEKSGACTYDSGGPLVCGTEAVGIVSFNYNEDCRYPNVPNIYTQISKYHDWIEKVTKAA